MVAHSLLGDNQPREFMLSFAPFLVDPKIKNVFVLSAKDALRVLIFCANATVCSQLLYFQHLQVKVCGNRLHFLSDIIYE